MLTYIALAVTAVLAAVALLIAERNLSLSAEVRVTVNGCRRKPIDATQPEPAAE